MADEERYDKISFAFAEHLEGELKEQCSINEGLIAIKTKIGSIPKYSFDKVDTTPTEYIKNLGEKRGLTRSKIAASIEGAFSE